MTSPAAARRLGLLAALLALAGLAATCRGNRSAAPAFPTAVVERGTVALTASADGVIEPIRKVEVKSKASGEVIEMAVDTGDQVEAGQVLLQLLPRDAQNVFDQATADLEAAAARLANAEVKLERSRRLYAEGLLSANDLDVDELAVTTARTEVVRAKKERETAAERLAETTVRSPIAGTVIGKSVEVGQVVSSAVSQVSGGTLLLTLADLAEVQVRSLIDEVDIGRVRPGQRVEIQVEAYPERAFLGEVLKVEPQAVVQQNVTMFPVLTRIANPEQLLKPGMNAEIEVLIDRRERVLKVPNDALKSPEEARRVAALLGLGGGADGAQPGPGESGGMRPPAEGGAAGDGGRGGGGGEGAGSRFAEGGLPPGPRGEWEAGSGARRGRLSGDGATPQARNGNRRVAFVAGEEGALQMVPVEIGLANWDVTEVVSGLSEGAQVVILPSAAQLRQSTEFRERMERMRGLPGMSSQQRRGNG